MENPKPDNNFFKNVKSHSPFLILLAIPTVFVLIIVPLSLFHAWIAQKLYGWFVLPLGAPELNIWHVWGLILIINYLFKSSRSDDDERVGRTLFAQVIVALLTLLIGFLIKGHI